MPHNLVVAGYSGWGCEEEFAQIEHLNLKDRVQFVDWVDQGDLAAFYNLAALFVYPSFYEAFGIPLLEAMACGCPIVASHTGAIPEIAGDAACLVDPRDAKSIADGMHRVLKDGDFRSDMISKGLRRAKQFSWQKCAAKTLEVIENALAG